MRRFVAPIALAVTIATSLSAQSHPLVGLWGGEATYGPALRQGTLVLSRVQNSWEVRLGSLEATTSGSADSATLSFPGGLGTVRVWQRIGDPPQAFWIQYSNGAPTYATPLRLAPAGPGRWHASITPLPERFSLYLSITQDSSGKLHTVPRNPEWNWQGWRRFTVSPHDGGIGLVDDTGRERFRQAWDSAGQQISFDFGGPLVLRPMPREQATGFVPRIGMQRPFRYTMPADLGDGWSVATAQSTGLNQARLAQLVELIASADPVSDTGIRIHSLQISHKGKLVLDEYFRGFGPDVLHDLRSASKSFTSILFGAAMATDRTLSENSLVVDRLPGTTIDRRMTVAHLLTHNSGLACDDDDDNSPGLEDRMQAESKDWYGHTLALAQLHAPGTHYAYCSGGINLVGAIVARTTGEWLPHYFDATLMRPLGITKWAMNLMPSGEGYSGGGVYLRPRDFLKIGELYLRGGKWQGRQVIARDWVERSTARHIDLPDGSTDGLAWHRHLLRVGDRSYQSYEASGNGGQFVIVVPDLELVVAVTAGNYGQYPVWRKIREEMVPQWVLGSVNE